MKTKSEEQIRGAVRARYAGIAQGSADDCGCSPGSCCSPDASITLDPSVRFGYSETELLTVPAGANLGLGCGNPQAIAALQLGEVVLDLGSGAGFDCFLAARQVGLEGRVIGVDMTPEMIAKARANAARGDYDNVEFRLGEIECLPVADNSVDAIISNCVINLSTDKPSVFREALRVLRPGGRLAVSDVVATAELPSDIREDLVLYSACAGGAATLGELEQMLGEAGFEEIQIVPIDSSREFIRDWAPGRRLEDYIVSASILARKAIA
jgi:SAM-dependent methyltransferase